MIPREFPGAAAIVAGTGPSLTPQSIDACNAARAAGKVHTFACNRAYQLFDWDVMHACNHQFYEHWEADLRGRQGAKWTTRPELRGRWPDVQYIEERWEPGLSRDPSYVCAHHGTGPQAVNIAYLYGCTRLLLVGWDMRFWGKRSRFDYERRRYLGEDPLTEHHWPMTGPKGEMTGLIKEMETIRPADYGIEILNCTPGSAMTCFPMMDLGDALAAL